MNGKGFAHWDLQLENISEGHEGDVILYAKLGTEGYKTSRNGARKINRFSVRSLLQELLFIICTGTPLFFFEH